MKKGKRTAGILAAGFIVMTVFGAAPVGTVRAAADAEIQADVGFKSRGAQAAAKAGIRAAQAAGAETQTAQAGADSARQETAHSLTDEEVSALLDFVKEKWDAGELADEEGIRGAIEEGQEKFGVSLEDSAKDQIAQALGLLDSLGLSHDTAISMAKELYAEHGDEIASAFSKLYEQYGETLADQAETAVGDQMAQAVGKALKEQLTDPLAEAVQEQVVEPAKEAAKDAVENTMKDFWKDLKDSVVSVFKNIFS